MATRASSSISAEVKEEAITTIPSISSAASSAGQDTLVTRASDRDPIWRSGSQFLCAISTMDGRPNSQLRSRLFALHARAQDRQTDTWKPAICAVDAEYGSKDSNWHQGYSNRCKLAVTSAPAKERLSKSHALCAAAAGWLESQRRTNSTLRRACPTAYASHTRTRR